MKPKLRLVLDDTVKTFGAEETKKMFLKALEKIIDDAIKEKQLLKFPRFSGHIFRENMFKNKGEIYG
jgi:hypothetical protein